MNHMDKLELAASKLAIRVPFIATIFSGLDRSIDESVATAAVGGMKVKFSPKLIDSVDDEELLFICAHEAMHPALLHPYRRGSRDMGLWNEAGDAVINPELISSGLKMPRWDAAKFAAYPEGADTYKVGDVFGVLHDWVTPEMETEVVYKRLLQEQEEQEKKSGGSGKPSPKGGWGDSGDLEDGGGEDATDGDSEAEVRVLVTQAARTAFAAGDKSSLVQRILGVARQSETDWCDETRTMLNDPSRHDYSYRRFSRRFMWTGLYLPSMYSEELGVLGCGIDTSGSMTSSQLAQINKELNAIVEDCAPSKVIVVYCDSNINRVDTFMAGEDVVLSMCGGGGTDMRKIVDYFSGVDERLSGVIIFTDLETPFPAQEPHYPLLWGAVGADPHIKPPVGRRVEVRV